MRATVFSITPAASPRQPACAMATVVPFRSANSTGTQSATSTAHTVCGWRATLASASGTAVSSSASTTFAACT